MSQPTSYSRGLIYSMSQDKREHDRNKPVVLSFLCGNYSDESGFSSTRYVGSKGGMLLGLAEQYAFGEWLVERFNSVIDGDWEGTPPSRPPGELALLDLFDGFVIEEGKRLRANSKPGYAASTNLALGDPSVLQPLAQQLQKLLSEVTTGRTVEITQLNEQLWR